MKDNVADAYPGIKTMSKKLVRSEQARMRRAQSKISLDLLHARATIGDYNVSEDVDYLKQKNKRSLFLSKEKKRSKT